MRQSALNADFGCSQIPCLFTFAPHVFERMKIGVGLTWPAAEGAKLAADETDVREIDITVYHIADDVADQVAPKRVRGYEQGEQVRTVAVGPVAVRPIAVRQGVALLVRQTCSVLRLQHALQYVADRRGNLWRDLVPGQRGELLEF